MARKSNGKRLHVYANLTRSRRKKKDTHSRKRAEYLASLPKHPLKRTLYRLHPKRVAGFWFSKRGGFMALKIAGVSLLLMVIGVGALFAYYRKDLDQIRPSELAKRVQTTVTKYYDRNGVLLWEDKGSGDYRLVVKPDEIADVMKQATIAIEDRDFYSHGGISVTGLARAAVNNASSDSVQGGSTLTQQLVKQVFFRDEAQKRGLDGIPRKIKEVILAIEVERMYDKDQILNLYLNESPYGGRRNGVESAAQTYFDKSAKQLTLAEAALLAGIPNQPGLYDPYNRAGNDALVERQHRVLNAMVDERYITEAQADAAKKVPIIDTIKPETDQYKNIKAPHFVQMVRSQLESELGKKVVGEGGLTVKTTLDYRMQKRLEAEMKSMFDSSYPDLFGFTNGAATLEDVKSGQILALMGSRDFRYDGFGQDNAATAFIQPGSSIKPLVYAQLFQDQGDKKLNFGSGSILSDVRTTFPIEGSAPWTPQNATGDFRGNINVRQSLALSRNIPAIKAMAIAGHEPTMKTIRDMGNKYYCTQGNEKQATLSASIGGCGTRMIDHVNALASLARGGVYKPHTSILEVTNSSGDVVSKYKSEQKRIINPQSAYIVNDILGDLRARTPLYGRSITPNLDAANIRVAVKTGTSNAEVNGVIQPKDIWTMTYTPSLSMGVWLGNSDSRALNSSAISAYASGVSDPVMVYATQLYEKDKKIKVGDWFTRPAGIQEIRGELFPSYYNKTQNQTNAKLTFDRVSKKRATDCTPDAAREEIAVTKTTDPFTKKTIYIAPNGYDANSEDDLHKCDDAQPRILGITVTDSQIEVRVSKGRFPIDAVTFRVNGRVVGSSGSPSGGTYTTLYDFTKKAEVSATVQDQGYYSDSASRTYRPSGNGNGNGNND